MKHSLKRYYEEFHRRRKFLGWATPLYTAQINELVQSTGTKTILDYGCGAGEQYTVRNCHHAWGGIMPWLYDPFVASFNKPPSGKFDGVLCNDVLEHIPEDELDEVYEELIGYTRLWCFISVCCRPANTKKLLPGGKNVHVTLRPPEWWREKIGAAFDGHVPVYLEFTP
jgi:hypothetical protein